jgi:hypothetical protein
MNTDHADILVKQPPIQLYAKQPCQSHCHAKVNTDQPTQATQQTPRSQHSDGNHDGKKRKATQQSIYQFFRAKPPPQPAHCANSSAECAKACIDPASDNATLHTSDDHISRQPQPQAQCTSLKCDEDNGGSNRSQLPYDTENSRLPSPQSAPLVTPVAEATTLTLMTWNTMGLTQVTEEVQALVEMHSPDIVILTETKLIQRQSGQKWIKDMLPRYKLQYSSVPHSCFGGSCGGNPDPG